MTPRRYRRPLAWWVIEGVSLISIATIAAVVCFSINFAGKGL